MKMKAVLIFGVSFLVATLFFKPVYYESDFYWYHVMECLEAHEKGYAFSLCSGWWVNVSDVKEDGPCLIMPWENPLYVVYHGSITYQKEMAYNRFHYNSIIQLEKREMRRMIKWWFENYADKYEDNPTPEQLYRWYCNFRGLLF